MASRCAIFQGSFADNVEITEDICLQHVHQRSECDLVERPERRKWTWNGIPFEFYHEFVLCSWDSGGKVEELAAAVGAGVISFLLGEEPGCDAFRADEMVTR